MPIAHIPNFVARNGATAGRLSPAPATVCCITAADASLTLGAAAHAPALTVAAPTTPRTTPAIIRRTVPRCCLYPPMIAPSKPDDPRRKTGITSYDGPPPGI